MRQTRIDNAAGDAAALALPDELQFMQLLWAVAHGLERTSKRMIQEIGVTGPQRLVLRVVGLQPGLSAGDVATILRVHPSTLTGVLHRLIGQGLLARESDPRDRRRAVLRLTKRGERANTSGAGTVEAVVAVVLRTVSDRDRACTRRVLARLADHLDRANPPSAVVPTGGRDRDGRGVN